MKSSKQRKIGFYTYECEGAGLVVAIIMFTITTAHFGMIGYYLYHLCVSLRKEAVVRTSVSGTRQTDGKIERNLKYLGMVVMVGSGFQAFCFSLYAMVFCGWITDTKYTLDDTLPYVILVAGYFGNITSYFALAGTFFVRLLFCFENTSYSPSGAVKTWYYSNFVICGVICSAGIVVALIPDGLQLATSLIFICLVCDRSQHCFRLKSLFNTKKRMCDMSEKRMHSTLSFLQFNCAELQT